MPTITVQEHSCLQLVIAYLVHPPERPGTELVLLAAEIVPECDKCLHILYVMQEKCMRLAELTSRSREHVA